MLKEPVSHPARCEDLAAPRSPGRLLSHSTRRRSQCASTPPRWVEPGEALLGFGRSAPKDALESQRNRRPAGSSRQPVRHAAPARPFEVQRHRRDAGAGHRGWASRSTTGSAAPPRRGDTQSETPCSAEHRDNAVVAANRAARLYSAHHPVACDLSTQPPKFKFGRHCCIRRKTSPELTLALAWARQRIIGRSPNLGPNVS